MIPNQWYAIVEGKKVKAGRPVGLRRLGERLVLWRGSGGEVVCMVDRCPHRGAQLSLGRIEEGCIECPYHGFRFDAQGECRLIPANGKGAPVPRGFSVERWPVREEHGLVWVWWGEARDAYPDLPWFDEAVGHRFGTAEMSGDWPINYARFLENYLDVHHFPFVHGRNLYPKVGPVVTSFIGEQHGDTIRMKAGLSHYDGPSDRSTPLRLGTKYFEIFVRFPNVTYGSFTERLRMAVIPTPIDDENTWMFVRYFQDYLPVPLLGTFLAKLLLWGDYYRVQWAQDLPIFKGQQPGTPSMSAGYRFIPADGAIVLYLKHREKLIAEARETGRERESASRAARR